jgi:transcriptional/translational regulatory protein YebC/TACO1
MFHRKARFLVSGDAADEEKLLELLIDAGVEDVLVDGDVAEIIAPMENFEAISRALEGADISPDEAGLAEIPENMSKVEDESDARKALRLLERLEDLDDVQAVHSNVDIPDDIMEVLSNEDA